MRGRIFLATTPSIDWKMLAEKLMIKGVDSIIVSNPSYLKTIDLLLTALPLEDWKSYVEWNLIRSSAPYLSNNFVEENFKFSSVTLGPKRTNTPLATNE
jgi:putative endopeptidase